VDGPEADVFYTRRRGKLIKVSDQTEPPTSTSCSPCPGAAAEVDRGGSGGGGRKKDVMKDGDVGRRNTARARHQHAAPGGAGARQRIPGHHEDRVRVGRSRRQNLHGPRHPRVRRTQASRPTSELYSLQPSPAKNRRRRVLCSSSSSGSAKVEQQPLTVHRRPLPPPAFGVNKWDLLYGQMPTERWVALLRDKSPPVARPIAFITGETGKKRSKPAKPAQMLYKQCSIAVFTSELNRLVRCRHCKRPAPHCSRSFPPQGLLRPNNSASSPPRWS